MAANAPEDGDSFGLLEEIAMRIAAAGVPDTTPIDEWPDPRGITLTDNKTDAPLADYCGQTLPLTDLDGDHVDCDPCHLACVLPRHHDDAGGWHYDEMDDVTWRKGRHVPVAEDAKPAPELAAVDLHRWYAVISQPDGTSKVIGYRGDSGISCYDSLAEWEAANE